MAACIQAKQRIQRADPDQPRNERNNTNPTKPFVSGSVARYCKTNQTNTRKRAQRTIRQPNVCICIHDLIAPNKLIAWLSPPIKRRPLLQSAGLILIRRAFVVALGGFAIFICKTPSRNVASGSAPLESKGKDINLSNIP